jgi:hypothetical protein
MAIISRLRSASGQLYEDDGLYLKIAGASVLCLHNCCQGLRIVIVESPKIAKSRERRDGAAPEAKAFASS